MRGAHPSAVLVLLGLCLLVGPARASRSPLILVVVQGGPGPDRAALEALAGAHGRVVFEENAPRLAGEDPAQAQTARLRARARAAVGQVRSLYYAGKPDRAAASARSFLDELCEPLAYAGVISELAPLWFWLAVSLAKAGQAAEASQAYARAVDLGAAPPEPGLLPPEVMQALEAGLMAAAARPKGRLRVYSMPPGATLSVDGRPAGKAPRTLELPLGEHYVAAERFGSRSTVRRIRLRGERETVLELALEPASAALLAAQVQARREEGLDLADAELIRALAQLYRADQVLAVVREPAAGKVTASRWNADGQRLAVAACVLPPAGRGDRAAALRVLGRGLWPAPAAPPPPPPPERPIWKRWWLWAIVGGAAAAAAGLGYAAASSRDEQFRIMGVK